MLAKLAEQRRLAHAGLAAQHQRAAPGGQKTPQRGGLFVAAEQPALRRLHRRIVAPAGGIIEWSRGRQPRTTLPALMQEVQTLSRFLLPPGRVTTCTV
jgi:hypothetical protein